MYHKKRLPHANPNPRNCIQAVHFVRSLSRITATAPLRHRCRAIRRAAYASMARSAGPTRAWSRALLAPTPVPQELLDDHPLLRGLIPGGHSMEFTSLLDETIDYVQRLRSQVHLMQQIVSRAEEKNPKDKN